MEDVPLEHVPEERPGRCQERSPDDLELCCDSARDVPRTQLPCEVRRERRAIREQPLDFCQRLLGRSGAQCLELTLDVPHDRFLRCQEMRSTALGGHESQQQLEVVLLEEPSYREILPPQPGSGRATRVQVRQRHRARQQDDLAEGRDREPIAQGVREREDERDHDGDSLGRAPSIWMRGSHPSQLGRYQFQRPSRLIALGSRIERTIVASIRSATATPNPICWNMISSPRAKPVKTAMMISAAPVMIRAVDATPKVTASVVSPTWS